MRPSTPAEMRRPAGHPSRRRPTTMWRCSPAMCWRATATPSITTALHRPCSPFHHSRRRASPEEAARAAGLKLRKTWQDTSGWFNTRRVGETASGFKVLVEEGTDHILGAHVLGPNAAEVINLFATTIRLRIPADDLKQSSLPIRRAAPTSGSCSERQNGYWTGVCLTESQCTVVNSSIDHSPLWHYGPIPREGAAFSCEGSFGISEEEVSLKLRGLPDA